MRKPLLSALLLGLLALGGCSLPQQQAGAPTEQRLGTQWGEGVASPVTSVALRRLSEQPVDRRQVFYSASRFDGRAIKELPLAKGRVGFAVLDEDGGKFDLVQHRSTAAPCNCRAEKASATACGCTTSAARPTRWSPR